MKITPALGPMSGKLGGIVASHNKGGAYFRRKSIPTNPNTARQQAVKNVFTTLVQAWTNTLTQAERDAWDTYASNVPVTDSLGAAINLSGQNWYIGNNTPRLQAGLARVDTAPTTFDGGNPVTSMATPNQGDVNVIGVDAGSMSTDVLINGAASDDGDVLIFLGAPINPSKKFYKGPWQLAAVVAVASAASTVSWATTITSLLSGNGAPTIGQTRAVRMRVAYDDGRLSSPFELTTTVVDDPV